MIRREPTLILMNELDVQAVREQLIEDKIPGPHSAALDDRTRTAEPYIGKKSSSGPSTFDDPCPKSTLLNNLIEKNQPSVDSAPTTAMRPLAAWPA